MDKDGKRDPNADPIKGNQPQTDASRPRERVQGEGNYDAAREFDEAQRRFVESGNVDAGARAARPTTEGEQQEMLDAERKAKSRAKEEDPAVKRPEPRDSNRRNG